MGIAYYKKMSMVLTFEKIRELQWNEKSEQKLQDLPKDFFDEVKEYLKRRDDEQIKLIVKDLIDRRERKILNSALSYFITGEFPKNMTKEESVLFENVLKNITEFRKNLFEGQQIIKEENKEDKNKENGFVLIKENLPCFIGPDLKTYELKKNDKVFLPENLKKLLLNHGYCDVL